MHIQSRLLAVLSLAMLLVPLTITAVHAGGSGSTHARGAPSLAKDLTFRMTDQLSAQTQAALFPRRDVAFSMTHRLWADTPEQGDTAARQELARLRLSQQVNPSGQEEHAFQRLEPAPLWADLLVEARVAPVSLMHLSTTVAYNPVATQLARVTAELRLQPLSFLILSLAPEFCQGSQLERLNGGIQLTLPGAWSVSYAIHSPSPDAAVASHTVTTRYRSSYGNVRLQLAQSHEETRAGVLVDIAAFLRRTLGF